MLKMYPECSSELIGCSTIRNYVLGGQGVITLESPSTGVSHTYHIKRPIHPEVFPDDIFFVYHFSPRKEWKYVGMIEGAKFRSTRASYYSVDSPEFKGVKYLMRTMWDEEFTPKLKVYHQGVCALCGRKLTNIKSIKIGIGPKCRKIING